ncbi:hypothetical protein BSKO_00014 [Bryopsis sp. KO-2023]|nr:hypothetical protein BSKO_00014 [Bryopsis sp. KO-2023]
MPRARRRVVTCDCRVCLDPLQFGSLSPFPSAAPEWGIGEVAARQEPPPKCLLVVATGIEQAALECPHLDGIARDGSTSLVAVRRNTFEDPSPVNQGLSCVAQIINPYKAEGTATESYDLLEDRFMGMHGGVASNCANVIQLGRKVGLEQLGDMNSNSGLDCMASTVSQYLGVSSEEKTLDGDQDFALIHVDGSLPFPCGNEDTTENSKKNFTQQSPSQHSSKWVEWIDSILRDLDNRSGVLAGVLVCVVLDCPAVANDQRLTPGGGSIAIKHGGVSRPADGFDFTKVLRPKQSFEFRGEDFVEVDLGRPLLMVQRLKGVIRRDQMDCVCLPRSNSGILAGHLLPEIAYKLARSKKYGA